MEISGNTHMFQTEKKLKGKLDSKMISMAQGSKLIFML